MKRLALIILSLSLTAVVSLSAVAPTAACCPMEWVDNAHPRIQGHAVVGEECRVVLDYRIEAQGTVNLPLMHVFGPNGTGDIESTLHCDWLGNPQHPKYVAKCRMEGVWVPDEAGFFNVIFLNGGHILGEDGRDVVLEATVVEAPPGHSK